MDAKMGDKVRTLVELEIDGIPAGIEGTVVHELNGQFGVEISPGEESKAEELEAGEVIYYGPDELEIIEQA